MLKELIRLDIDVGVASQDLVNCYHISSSSAMVERREIKTPKSLLVWQVSELWHHLCSSPLNPFYQLLVSPVEWSPYKVPIFNVGTDEGFVQQRQCCGAYAEESPP